MIAMSFKATFMGLCLFCFSFGKRKLCFSNNSSQGSNCQMTRAILFVTQKFFFSNLWLCCKATSQDSRPSSINTSQYGTSFPHRSRLRTTFSGHANNILSTLTPLSSIRECWTISKLLAWNSLMFPETLIEIVKSRTQYLSSREKRGAPWTGLKIVPAYYQSQKQNNSQNW